MNQALSFNLVRLMRDSKITGQLMAGEAIVDCEIAWNPRRHREVLYVYTVDANGLDQELQFDIHTLEAL